MRHLVRYHHLELHRQTFRETSNSEQSRKASVLFVSIGNYFWVFALKIVINQSTLAIMAGLESMIVEDKSQQAQKAVDREKVSHFSVVLGWGKS